MGATGEPKKERPDRRLSGSTLAALALTVALIVAALVVALRAAPFVPGPAPAERLGFATIGHRGARGLMPGNTLPGFERALATGVTTLDLDVVLTADGHPAVLHDLRLPTERTRGPDGGWLPAPGPPVLDLSLAELQRLDVGCARPGSGAAERFPNQLCLKGVPPPDLSAVLALGEALSGGRIGYAIETKLSPLDATASGSPEALAAAVVAALRAAGAERRAAVQSFDWRSLAAVRSLAPEIPTVHLTAEQPWLDTLQRGHPGASPWLAGHDADDHPGRVPALVAAAGGAVWSPYWRDLRSGDIKAAHALGLRVVAWTVNDPAAMARLIEDGVDGIVTDYPDRLRVVLADKGLALPPAYLRVPERPAGD